MKGFDMAPYECPSCEDGVVNDSIGGDCSNGCTPGEQTWAGGFNS